MERRRIRNVVCKSIVASYFMLVSCTGAAVSNHPTMSPVPSLLPPSPSIPAVPTLPPQPSPTLVEIFPEYNELDAIVLSAGTSLFASPSRPNSSISDSNILPGEQVYLTGRDSNGAWLLIVHNNQMGWVPSMLSGTGVGTLNIPSLTEPWGQACNGFLGAVSRMSSVWMSPRDGEIVVQGYFYLPANVGNIELRAKNQETGENYISEMQQFELQRGGNIVSFTTKLTDMRQGNHVAYEVDGLGQAVPFQAAYFTAQCSSSDDFQEISGVVATPNAYPTMEVRVVWITPESLPTLVPGTGFDWSQCHATYTTRLWVGARASVTTTPAHSNNVRAMPYKNAELRGKIAPGEVVTITKGPSCSSGLIWWKISAKNGSLEGWTAEGDSQNYWLAPYK